MSTRAPERRSSSARCARDSAVERGGDTRQLRGQGRGDQLGAVGGHQRDRVAAAHAQAVQQVRVAVHVGQQLAEGAPRRLRPARGLGQHGDRDPLGPQRRRAGEQRVGGLGQAAPAAARPRSRPGRPGWRSRATAGRWSSGVPHDRALRAEVDHAVVGGHGGLDDVAVLQVLRVARLAAEEDLPLRRGRSSERATRRFGRRDSAVPTGVPVSTRSPGSSCWKRASAAAPAPAGRSCRRDRRPAVARR